VQSNLYACVRFTCQGWHCWPDAPEKRKYLASSHRHLFHIEVQIEVSHAEREIEYHDLLDFCQEKFVGGDMGSWSCETMAQYLIKEVASQYPGRPLLVSVYEDGEVGAVVTYSSDPKVEITP